MVTIKQLSRWLIALEGLTLFSNIRKHRTIQNFVKLCDLILSVLDQEGAGQGDSSPVLSLAQQRSLMHAWAEFAESLIIDIDPRTPVIDWEIHITNLVLGDENPFTLALEHNTPSRLPQAILDMAKIDLERLQELAGIDTTLLAQTVSALVNVPHETALNSTDKHNITGQISPNRHLRSILQPPYISTKPWADSIDALGDWIHTHGAGILGQHHAFIWKHQHNTSNSLIAKEYLSPVINADTVSLEDLSGYDEQRSVVLENTRRFVEGKTANNLLLYGDRGTGKSATVKAVCRAFADRGLKLIEVRKRDLMHFETIAEILSRRGPLFVLFIDDLSFEDTDDTFTGLKALLEGGLERRPSNMVIYATSNRRHLVKEHFADRPTTALAAEAQTTGDVRAFDTMQEQLSLADRFGITVVFTAPTQEAYLAIAEAIAAKRGILPQGDQERQQFRQNALRWERWFNGRSPRTAQQFVDWLSGGEGFPWE